MGKFTLARDQPLPEQLLWVNKADEQVMVWRRATAESPSPSPRLELKPYWPENVLGDTAEQDDGPEGAENEALLIPEASMFDPALIHGAWQSVCSNGRPLIEELDRFRWGVFSLILEEFDRGDPQTTFVQAFHTGNADQEVYAQFLSSLYHVYSTLEQSANEYQDDPNFSKVHFPEIHRADRIAHDLAYLRGPKWNAALSPSPMTERYTGRIRLSHKNPLLLIAHHYVRYLGDLISADDNIAVLQKEYEVPEEGLNFYRFDDLGEIAVSSHSSRPLTPIDFIRQYQVHLDAMGLSPEQCDKLVEEAKFAYRMGLSIYDELGRLIEPSPPTPNTSPPDVPRRRADSNLSAQGDVESGGEYDVRQEEIELENAEDSGSDTETEEEEEKDIPLAKRPMFMAGLLIITLAVLFNSVWPLLSGSHTAENYYKYK